MHFHEFRFTKKVAKDNLNGMDSLLEEGQTGRQRYLHAQRHLLIASV